MSETVWISTAMGHASNQRPFRNDMGERNKERLLQVEELICQGVSLGPEDFPQAIWGAGHSEETDYKLPHLFQAYGYWVVSAVAAEVLRQFDLGQGALYPVKVLKKDRETPVGGEWYCINFGNQKAAFLPDKSLNLRERYIRNGEKGWFAKAALSDNDFAVSPAASAPPDIWIDPIVGSAFFLSDALATALQKAKADKGFFLSKCRVISN